MIIILLLSIIILEQNDLDPVILTRPFPDEFGVELTKDLIVSERTLALDPEDHKPKLCKRREEGNMLVCVAIADCFGLHGP